MLGAKVLSFACSSPVGGMHFGVSGLLLLEVLTPLIDRLPPWAQAGTGPHAPDKRARIAGRVSA